MVEPESGHTAATTRLVGNLHRIPVFRYGPVVLAEAGERHQAAVLRLEPGAPERRCHVAHVGDRVVADLGWAGKPQRICRSSRSPSLVRTTGAIWSGKMAGRGGTVAGAVAAHLKGPTHRLLGGVEGIEITLGQDPPAGSRSIRQDTCFEAEGPTIG